MLTVSTFTTVLKKPFTASYYNQKSWEQGGKIYERLGINFFRKLLVWTGWEKVIRKSFPIEKNTKALAGLYVQTKKSELDHLVILLIVVSFNLFVAFKFEPVKSLWLLMLNIILNLYPIFLQRYNRPKIERILNRSKQK